MVGCYINQASWFTDLRWGFLQPITWIPLNRNLAYKLLTSQNGTPSWLFDTVGQMTHWNQNGSPSSVSANDRSFQQRHQHVGRVSWWWALIPAMVGAMNSLALTIMILQLTLLKQILSIITRDSPWLTINCNHCASLSRSNSHETSSVQPTLTPWITDHAAAAQVFRPANKKTVFKEISDYFARNLALDMDLSINVPTNRQ